ncbi:MAG TPA: hypothetical protein DDX71_06435 [Ruminococcus sp.]|nr:hypothetical protein [Ruminococcus sp.]
MIHRTKKAAVYAAMVYLAVLGLGLSMLRAAQQTRRTLYGGHPVMAQLSRTLPHAPEKAPDSYSVELGGGEWSLGFSLPDPQRMAHLTDALPPCTAKLMLRLLLLAPDLADQTAECIRGI